MTRPFFLRSFPPPFIPPSLHFRSVKLTPHTPTFALSFCPTVVLRLPLPARFPPPPFFPFFNSNSTPTCSGVASASVFFFTLEPLSDCFLASSFNRSFLDFPSCHLYFHLEFPTLFCPTPIVVPFSFFRLSQVGQAVVGSLP